MAQDKPKNQDEPQNVPAPAPTGEGKQTATFAPSPEAPPAPVITDPRHPDYDERAHMEQIISEGGSVQYRDPSDPLNPRIITNVNQLPSRATLAKDNPTKLAQEREALARRREALDQELAAVDRQLAEGKRSEGAPSTKEEKEKP